ncbi:MAG: AAA family ATPase [Ktedonobacterales bacterium]|nr:AAA family ATPase [Ktedonobacterales bacterium]
MTNVYQTTDAEASPAEPLCFLCAYSAHPCQIAQVEGTLIGARVEQRQAAQTGHTRARSVPVIGVRTDDGARVRVNLGPEHVGLVSRLAALTDEARQLVRLRVWHLAQGKANPPAPGQDPFRVALALPESLVVVAPDLLLNITDLSQGDYCVRQEVLHEMFPGTHGGAAVRGTLIHNIFKERLKDPTSTTEILLEDGLHAAVVALAEAGTTENEVRTEVAPHLAALDAWYARQGKALDPQHVRAESFLLAPELGLKGRLDILWADGADRRLLELKTGKPGNEPPKLEHRWQVYGYHALLAARGTGAQRLPGATLLYSSTSDVATAFGIPAKLHDMQRVMALRNELALVRVTGRVPAPPGGNKCARCMLHPRCAEASALLGWEAPPGDAPLRQDDRTAKWFRHWWSLQRLEGRAAEAQTHALWQQSAAERIAAGSAIQLTETLGMRPDDRNRHEWIYTFRCANASELREGDEVLLSEGDPVLGQVVSGAILRISNDRLEVWAREQIDHPTLLDRYTADVMNRRMQHNLTRWLHGDAHRQKLVRGEVTPRFDHDAPPFNLEATRGLNAEQADAVVRALTMKDYLLIQGPPGTGKTNVIAAITQALLARGYRVALAAYTNQATDTMLRRLVLNGITNVVRLGHELSAAPEVRDYRLLPQTRARTGQEHPSAEEVRRTMRAAPVVAATVATWSAEAHEVEATMPLFDVVIIDEASQLTVPAALGALRWGRRFILVGDSRQLPPLVQSEAAKLGGLGASLFDALRERATENDLIALKRQYRMHADICAFPSQQFYGGRLIADGSVATATLPITPARYEAILDPARPLVWVDVMPQDGGQSAKLNEAEARVAAALAHALADSGLDPSEIGIIAPFRAQVAHIRHLAEDLVRRGATIDTVDRFQGGERAAIILSLVIATPPGEGSPVSGFLDEPRRLNVGLTRARQKLIILGHRPALEAMPLLHALAEHCANKVRWDGPTPSPSGGGSGSEGMSS